jgi:hypothetical protein
MKNIGIVSYYGLKEALKIGAEALIKLGYNVSDFPLYRYSMDTYDKVDDYIDLFIDYIIKNDIHVLLWWNFNIDTDKFKYIKDKTNVKYILFNWDGPHTWSISDMKNKAPYIDAAYLSSRHTCKKFIKYGTQNVHWLLPGFSPIYNFINNKLDNDVINKYECDISFCCTNLYNDTKNIPEKYINGQFINRKNLIDDIYMNQEKYGYKFNLYGPEYLKELYPDSYIGFASYFELNNIFNYSKINLCTHLPYNTYGYLNERAILIGASGGLLLIDPVYGIDEIFDTQNDLLLLDKFDYINQIVNILKNYDDYIDKRLNINYRCNKYYTYDNWAQKINDTFLSQL